MILKKLMFLNQFQNSFKSAKLFPNMYWEQMDLTLIIAQFSKN